MRPLASVRSSAASGMSLSQMQKSLIERARSVGDSEMAVPIGDAAGAYLLARTVVDLGLQSRYAELPEDVPPFYETAPVSSLALDGVNFEALAERVFNSTPDADTYFSCLAALLKARLKFERILRRQPFPTMDQVGPRGLLQYGSLSSPALAGLLYWRKWFYDTDNRAAQETGYLFEPILAAAIGGAPASATRSPVRRFDDATKGRQVDCIKGKFAYEFKIRVTIAASGQGRWNRELAFPKDCASSNYIPVLVVLDDTTNPKLEELVRVFETTGGKAHLGQAAWRMLEDESGPVMSQFLTRYVRRPLDALIRHAPTRLPDLSARDTGTSLVLEIGGEPLVLEQDTHAPATHENDPMPDDADDALPGV